MNKIKLKIKKYIKKIILLFNSEKKVAFKLGIISSLIMVFIIVIITGIIYSEKIENENKKLISNLELIDKQELEKEENLKKSKKEEKLLIELNNIKEEIKKANDEVDLQYTTGILEEDIKYYKDLLVKVTEEKAVIEDLEEELNYITEDRLEIIEENNNIIDQVINYPTIEKPPVTDYPIIEKPPVTEVVTPPNNDEVVEEEPNVDEYIEEDDNVSNEDIIVEPQTP